MFWQEDDELKKGQVTDDILDLLFNIKCREIPVDHAHALSVELKNILPVIEEDERICVHTIHVAGSQNGWERPEFSTESRILLSNRTKMTLRVPKELAEEIEKSLDGASIQLEECQIKIGSAKRKPLSKQGTIFSRYVQCGLDEEEMAFMQRMIDELKTRGIRIKKALCGKTTLLHTPDGPVATRSLMLAELSTEDSIRLQQQGLGPGREMGCGIFIPHKGIEAVKESYDDIES